MHKYLFAFRKKIYFVRQTSKRMFFLTAYVYKL
jgi:hypothetical protein